MKRALRFYVIGLLFCCFYSAGSLAYEVEVHKDISKSAFEQAISGRNFLADLGLNPNEKINGEIPEKWVIFGSAWEDNIFPPGLPPRSAYHFFDPINGKGLNGTFHGIPYNYKAAPDWAADAMNNPLYSIPEARYYMYLAFTSTDPTVRANALATTFRAVGQFTHLLQDMAQPQHVRNDVHLSPSEDLDWIFTGWSRYERYTLAKIASLTYTGYPTVNLPNYRSYWIGAGKGLAEFTNGNFVSEGTNFGSGTSYTSPSLAATTDTPEILATVQDVQGKTLPYTNISVRYKGNSFTDVNTGAPVSNPKLSTYSMFDFLNNQYTSTNVYTLNNANHDAYANLLIPRAVGYSAGLINYFFRGKMQISLPPEGVYSLIDVSKDSGFSKVKLALSNQSPPGEDMIGGQVVAIAKFHNNTCYKSDLSGEMGLPGNNYNTCRSSDEQIIVSTPKPLSLAAGASAAPLTFDFSSPIPLSATDLYLQVVYRGQLGQELDAVAVTTLDIAEPTTFDITNMTDYVLLDGLYYYVPDPYDPTGLPSPTLYGRKTLERVSLSYQFNFGGSASGSVTVPASSFARMGILTNTTGVFLNLTKVSYGYSRVLPVYPNLNQLDPLTGVPNFSTPAFARGRYLYQDSPDYLFYPALIMDPPGPIGLSNLAPQPINTIVFPAP